MVDALHHVLDSRQTAGELWRVLKAGGKIVIEEPDIRKFAVKLVSLAEKLLLMRSHFLTASAIQNLFPYPHARTRLVQENHIIWVVIDKVDSFQGLG